MHANRRRQCEAWSTTSTPAFCYRFDVRNTDVAYLDGVTHFEEVSFVFKNFDGQGYHYGKPFVDVPDSYFELSTLMASMWASFIHDLDPNSGIGSTPTQDVSWSSYRRDNPVDIVFDTNVTSHMEADAWRGDAIGYINSIARAYWR